MTDTRQDELDLVLDAALAKYAAVDPRPGLEERVLAKLRAERQWVPDRGWWRWSALAAVAAVAIVAIALAWRPGKPSDPEIANHPLILPQGAREPGAQIVSNDGGNQVRSHEPGPVRKTIARRSPTPVVTADNPKLGEFPSPAPLSEQEKLLRNYVAEYPEQAVLLARARTEELRRDQLEEMKAFPANNQPVDSEEPNDDTTER
jgi:hypothetical protein